DLGLDAANIFGVLQAVLHQPGARRHFVCAGRMGAGTNENQDFRGRRVGLLRAGYERQKKNRTEPERDMERAPIAKIREGLHSHPVLSLAFFLPLPFLVASARAASGLLGVGSGALISLRQANSRLCRSRVLSGIVVARLFFSPISSRRL